MIRHAGKELISIKVGCVPCPDESTTSSLTGTFLAPLSFNHGFIGNLLESIHLYNHRWLDYKSLCDALLACSNLTDLKIVGLNMDPIEKVLESITRKCEHLFIESEFKSGTLGDLYSMTSFWRNCPDLTSLSLIGFALNDSEVSLLIKSFHKLKYLNLSSTFGINGRFLSIGCKDALLKTLILRDSHCLEKDVSNGLELLLAMGAITNQSFLLKGERRKTRSHICGRFYISPTRSLYPDMGHNKRLRSLMMRKSSRKPLIRALLEKNLSKRRKELICNNTPKHLVAAVKGLHWKTSLEMHKLLKDNHDYCISFNDSKDEEGVPLKINVEKMVRMLPLHLIAVIMTRDRDEKEKFQYVLCGIRLLNTFCDLTSRHPKLEQVLLDDVKLSDQMLDLVILLIIIHARNRKDSDSLIDATLVASSLHFLHGFISPNSQDLVQVLLVHSKFDALMDCAFASVHNVVRSLRKKLVSRRSDNPDILGDSSVEAVDFHCQQAEASLQFLHSLCQHKIFRDRIAKNKELCGKGGVLMLAQTILSLTVTPEFAGASVMLASISRMKAKMLSILQHLFEAESVSFLDEVASAGNLGLAKTVASEVLQLLRLGLSKAAKGSASHEYPMGFVLLNAMRLADVLTDDSNFRSFFTEEFSMVLSAVFCLSHGDFLSMLCSSDLSSREDDATLDYDLFSSSGWVLSIFSDFSQPPQPQFKLNFQNNLSMASYAHQRTSLFVKMIANLHCFVPSLCQEQDRNRFILNFMSGLRKDPSSILVNVLPISLYTPMAQRGTGVCRNLCSLLRHAESLIPRSLNEEDFLLLRVFCDQLQPLIRSEFEESEAQVKDNNIQVTVENNPSGKQQQQRKEQPVNLSNEEEEEALQISNLRAAITTTPTATKQSVGETEIVETWKDGEAYASNLETSGSDSSSNRGGKSPVNRVVEEDKAVNKEDDGEKAEASSSLLVFEKQRKKRKRSIMNGEQMVMIEKALADEPDMQRNSASIQFWADKLTQNGSEVITSSQLKNWLNNRKAKLARANKQTEPVRYNTNSTGDLPESPGDENTSLQQQQKQQPSTPLKDQANSVTSSNTPMKPDGPKQGQQVMLIDERGDALGKGTVSRTDGEWYGLNLEARRVCVVDVIELVTNDWSKMMIPYGSDDVGKTFGEANSRFGVMRVAWDLNKLQEI